MLKDLFNKRCRIQLERVEMKALDDPPADAKGIEVAAEDSVTWKKEADCLHVECTRHVGFEPACNFEITVTYAVDHYLKEQNALDKIEDAVIEQEVQSDILFYYRIFYLIQCILFF